VGEGDPLLRGRELYAQRAWAGAYAALSEADAVAALGADDLELLARSAYLLGHDDECVAALERAVAAHLEAGDPGKAARQAFWIGHNVAMRGEAARSAGWFARAERILASDSAEHVEQGYLLIPAIITSPDPEHALGLAKQAAELAERFDDPDLLALMRMEQGIKLVALGRREDGYRLVDETLVSLSTRELSPVVSGIVYCNTILFCAAGFELARAREWTAALDRWCDEQPEMLAHTGLCLVHRAEVLDLGGDWARALEATRRAARRTQGLLNQGTAGHGHYREAEILRRQGALDEAERAYDEAAAHGREPQPGLSLLRLAQGRLDVAVASISRVEAEVVNPLDRARVLPAFIEVMLAAARPEDARRACAELVDTATTHRSSVLEALACQARGALALAEGDPKAALASLRGAWQVWHAFGAPYECARLRVLVAQACLALGDADTAALELRLAREAFVDLGALPDVRAVDALDSSHDPARGGLTPREHEVLREVARGATNKEIAGTLVISERTVDRHVSNLLTKLGVPTRAAATAYAFEHDLL
jgi:DNA-binding CsgD family transcriptional regulator/tetratricopeptide (TPR) repeat protein